MNTTKFLKASLATLMGVTMLAGCSSSETTTTSTASASGEEEAITATLTVWAPEEDNGEGGWLETELEAFKAEHPNWDITFETAAVSEGDVKDKVATDPETAADVYLFANDQIPDLLKSQAIAELGGETVENVKANNSATTVATVTYEDAVYGVPFTSNTWFMYYDKRVFSEDDVKNLDTMLEKGVVGFPLSNSWYIQAFYVANGCTLFGEDGSDADAGVDFGGDKAVAVTNYLVDLVANKNFVDYNGADVSPSMLSDGTVNAIFSGTWDYDAVVEALGEENVGICAAPTYTLDGEEKQLKAFAGSKAIGVNPNCENMQVAVALAGFLGSTEAQQAHYEMRNIIPTDTSIDVGDDALAKAQMDTMDYASVVQPIQEGMAQYWTPAESMGNELVKGTVTHDNAEEKTETMNEQMNSSAVN